MTCRFDVDIVQRDRSPKSFICGPFCLFFLGLWDYMSADAFATRKTGQMGLEDSIKNVVRSC